MAQIEWKNKKEIEAEENAPKPPTESERLDALEKVMLDIVLGGVNNG